MYPVIKDPRKYTLEDLPKLAKNYSKDTFASIIESLTNESQTKEPKFLTVLASLIHEKEEELTVQLYNKMKELSLPVNSS